MTAVRARPAGGDPPARAAAGDRYWLWIAAVSVFVITLNGVGTDPDHRYRMVAANLFINRPEWGPAPFFRRDLLLPVLAHLLGVSRPGAFEALCAIILGGTLVGIAAALRRQVPAARRIAIYTLIVAQPVITILLAWIGMADVITFALTAVVLFTASPMLIGIAALLSLLNHSAAIIALAMTVAVRAVARDGIGRAHVVAMLSGAAAGWLLATAFLSWSGIAWGGRIDYALAIGIGRLLTMNARLAPTVLWSMQGGCWVACVLAAIRVWPRRPVYVLTVAAVMAASLAVAAVTLDVTRVMTLLAWAPAAHLWMTAARTAPDALDPAAPDERSMWAVACLVALTSPRIFILAGEIRAVPFGHWLFRSAALILGRG